MSLAPSVCGRATGLGGGMVSGEDDGRTSDDATESILTSTADDAADVVGEAG
jgi:hypothetical protein